MKKFSDLNNNNNNNEEIQESFSIENEIDNLIKESLTIEIVGEDKPWEKDFQIKAEGKFYENIQNVINKIYHKEKVELLEKARQSFFTQNYEWINEEVDKINESLNDTRNI